LLFHEGYFQIVINLRYMHNQINEDIKKSLALTQKLLAFVSGKETFFSATQKAFWRYWETLQMRKDERLTEKVNHYSMEVLSRLSQLDLLLNKVKLLEKDAEFRRQSNIGKKPLHLQWIESLESSQNDYNAFPLTEEIVDSLVNDSDVEQVLEIEVYTEAFYYFAHRLLKIIQYYPGLEKFKAQGVTLVRNHLIEHPHGTDGVSAPSFGYGDTNGPAVKPGSFVGDERKIFDAGLYKNAEEFRTNLNAELAKVSS